MMPQQVDPVDQMPVIRHRTKSCPFCAETIRSEAVKCRFCGEFLYGDRSQTEARFGPDAANSQEPTQETPESEEGDGILWFGRPSVLALMKTFVKMGIFVALCWALYWYPVTALVTYIPTANVSMERLVQIEVWLDLGALGLIVAAVLALIWKLIALKSIYYEVTADRIEWCRGVFDRHVDNIDMFRVIDLKLRRSLLECMLGIGTVTLITKDETDPHFDFVKVRQCRYLYDVLKEAGLKADKKRGVIHLE